MRGISEWRMEDCKDDIKYYLTVEKRPMTDIEQYVQWLYDYEVSPISDLQAMELIEYAMDIVDSMN